MTNEDTFNSLNRAQWIDQACDRFESAWLAGKPVTIESMLEASHKSVRETLMNELAAIEIELRRKQGESILVEEYVRCFPGIDPKVVGLADSVVCSHPRSSADHPKVDSPGVARSSKHDDFIGTRIACCFMNQLCDDRWRGDHHFSRFRLIQVFF